MAGFLHARVNLAIRRLENLVDRLLGHQFPTGSLALASLPVGRLEGSDHDSKRVSGSSVLNDLLGNGFLWAAPRNRRTIERRLQRKFGSPEYVYKLIQPKTNLLLCNTCGHNHEAGVLCPNCYEKIRLETEAMQTAIQADLGLSPVDKEVIVLYEGEKQVQPEEFWEGKRIVEMKKERPPWFSKNLLQPTTSAPATSSDVKPSELA